MGFDRDDEFGLEAVNMAPKRVTLKPLRDIFFQGMFVYGLSIFIASGGREHSGSGLRWSREDRWRSH